MRMCIAYILKYTPMAVGCTIAVYKLDSTLWAIVAIWTLVAGAAWSDYYIRSHT